MNGIIISKVKQFLKWFNELRERHKLYDKAWNDTQTEYVRTHPNESSELEGFFAALAMLMPIFLIVLWAILR